jgi:hypothetical protein
MDVLGSGAWKKKQGMVQIPIRPVVDYVYVDVEFDNKACKERISVQFQLGQL